MSTITIHDHSHKVCFARARQRRRLERQRISSVGSNGDFNDAIPRSGGWAIDCKGRSFRAISIDEVSISRAQLLVMVDVGTENSQPTVAEGCDGDGNTKGRANRNTIGVKDSAGCAIYPRYDRFDELWIIVNEPASDNQECVSQRGDISWAETTHHLEWSGINQGSILVHSLGHDAISIPPGRQIKAAIPCDRRIARPVRVRLQWPAGLALELSDFHLSPGAEP